VGGIGHSRFPVIPDCELSDPPVCGLIDLIDLSGLIEETGLLIL